MNLRPLIWSALLLIAGPFPQMAWCQPQTVEFYAPATYETPIFDHFGNCRCIFPVEQIDCDPITITIDGVSVPDPGTWMKWDGSKIEVRWLPIPLAFWGWQWNGNVLTARAVQYPDTESWNGIDREWLIGSLATIEVGQLGEPMRLTITAANLHPFDFNSDGVVSVRDVADAKTVAESSAYTDARPTVEGWITRLADHGVTGPQPDEWQHSLVSHARTRQMTNDECHGCWVNWVPIEPVVLFIDGERIDGAVDLLAQRGSGPPHNDPVRLMLLAPDGSVRLAAPQLADPDDWDAYYLADLTLDSSLASVAGHDLSWISDPRAVRLIVGPNSPSAFIAYLPFERADLDRGGSVGAEDLTMFLAAWFSCEPVADWDGDGSCGVPDIFAFLTAWYGG